MSSRSQANSQKSHHSLSFVVPFPDEMATKTQFAAAFLLLSMMSSSYASAQLLTCPLGIAGAVVCNIFAIIQIPPVTTFLRDACCSLLSPMSPNMTVNCLCLSLQASIFGIFISLPGAVNIVLSGCGKNYTIGSCS